VKQSGLQIVKKHGIVAPEYAVVGWVASLIGKDPIGLVSGSRNPIFVCMIVPLCIVAGIVECIFFVFGQSPIGLVVARKSKS
jgi:hypothetical protein